MDEKNACVCDVMKYYEAIQKEISSFAPAWMDLGDIMLSERRKTDTTRSRLYAESRENKAN